MNIQEVFQLTTSRRGRLRILPGSALRRHFNSRPHEEVDMSSCRRFHRPCYFNSRPHEEVDQDTPRTMWIKGIFQLTTSRRGRRKSGRRSRHFKYFNSRPHEEVDETLSDLWESGGISTHDLTKRSTYKQSGYTLFRNISTHDLTKRSTRRTHMKCG